MIAITTPTGKVGSTLVEALLTADAPMRVLARDPEKLSPSLRARVEVVTGSLEDAIALGRLLEGADSLFWCQPDMPHAADYLGAYDALAQAGAAAIRSAGVARVVALSAAGSPGAVPAGPITALHSMERVLAATGAALRCLRCGSFFENVLWQWDAIQQGGPFGYPASGSVPGPQVACADIAACAADWLLESGWSDQQALALVGPEDLTYEAMAHQLSVALGKPVAFHRMTLPEYRVQMMTFGMSASACEAMGAMFAYLETEYFASPHAPRWCTPTTFGAWLAAHRAGAGGEA